MEVGKSSINLLRLKCVLVLNIKLFILYSSTLYILVNYVIV